MADWSKKGGSRFKMRQTYTPAPGDYQVEGTWFDASGKEIAAKSHSVTHSTKKPTSRSELKAAGAKRNVVRSETRGLGFAGGARHERKTEKVYSGPKKEATDHMHQGVKPKYSIAGLGMAGHAIRMPKTCQAMLDDIGLPQLAESFDDVELEELLELDGNELDELLKDELGLKVLQRKKIQKELKRINSVLGGEVQGGGASVTAVPDTKPASTSAPDPTVDSARAQPNPKPVAPATATAPASVTKQSSAKATMARAGTKEAQLKRQDTLGYSVAGSDSDDSEDEITKMLREENEQLDTFKREDSGKTMNSLRQISRVRTAAVLKAVEEESAYEIIHGMFPKPKFGQGSCEYSNKEDYEAAKAAIQWARDTLDGLSTTQETALPVPVPGMAHFEDMVQVRFGKQAILRSRLQGQFYKMLQEECVKYVQEGKHLEYDQGFVSMDCELDGKSMTDDEICAFFPLVKFGKGIGEACNMEDYKTAKRAIFWARLKLRRLERGTPLPEPNETEQSIKGAFFKTKDQVADAKVSIMWSRIGSILREKTVLSMEPPPLLKEWDMDIFDVVCLEIKNASVTDAKLETQRGSMFGDSDMDLMRELEGLMAAQTL